MVKGQILLWSNVIRSYGATAKLRVATRMYGVSGPILRRPANRTQEKGGKEGGIP